MRSALTRYEAGDFEAARKEGEDIVLQGRGEELEAALYLLVRTDIALKNYDAAQRGCERLLRAFPGGDYHSFARFSRAEASFMLDEVAESKRDLEWCADSSRNERLSSRAREILENRTEFDHREYLFPADRVTRRSEYAGSELRPKVILLLAFPDVNDPAPRQLREAFLFGSDKLDLYSVQCWTVNTALGALQALDSAARGGVDFIVFAGDEGSATTLALANDSHQIPILKLTSTPRSLSLMCEGMIEFLPSQETIAANAAKYVAEAMHVKHGILLTPESDLGRAHLEGFLRSEDYGLVFDAKATYPYGSGNVRQELYDLVAAPARLDRGGEMVDALLSRAERERLFGDQNGGEVSVQAATNSGSRGGESPEAFFFSLSGDQINNYCSQLGNLPADMFFVGNSAWLDERALNAQAHITRRMIIGAPLLPEPDRITELVNDYVARTSVDATAWETLGLDAAEFVSALFMKQKASGGDFVQAAREIGEFRGASVIVEIGADGENKRARILEFDGSKTRVVR
ncbi:MAG: hypothetical protein H6508_04075 [Calditrichaeota bacterium]|nr:hypothetical protein [Calditrichota bacterium]MCB9366345.1 hypothetical protein [Calditrichota bacterium]